MCFQINSISVCTAGFDYPEYYAARWNRGSGFGINPIVLGPAPTVVFEHDKRQGVDPVYSGV